MKMFNAVALGLAAGLVLAVPQTADAQSSDGWWQWALEEVAEQDRDRGTSIGDIILGRDSDARDQRNERREDTRERREERREEARERREDARDRNDRGQKGPPFCRNGEGHPVHGQQWCRDKGFGGGTVWSRGTLGDIIFGSPRGSDRDDRRGAVDQGGLIDVLGDVVFGRLDSQRQRLGGSAPLEGRWIQPRDGARVLQIRSGSVPVAELTDADDDGRVDFALVPQPKR